MKVGKSYGNFGMRLSFSPSLHNYNTHKKVDEANQHYLNKDSYNPYKDPCPVRVDGLLTLEEVIEVIIGESIQDEFDEILNTIETMATQTGTVGNAAGNALDKARQSVAFGSNNSVDGSPTCKMSPSGSYGNLHSAQSQTATATTGLLSRPGHSPHGHSEAHLSLQMNYGTTTTIDASNSKSR